MRLKKPILLLLALCVLALSGCGQSAAAAQNSPPPAPVETEAPATPEPTPTPVPAIELPPLPDIDITSWEYLYAGPEQGVGRYHPNVTNIEGQYMDSRCVDATAAFLAGAREQGYTVYIGVGYRNFEYSLFYYEEAIREYGSAYEACRHVFAAGCSEHSTGLAIDITDEGMYAANYYNLHDETVADTPVCQWMDAHCTDYGFIVRYPAGKEAVYGMACYPGHYRYVGVEAAKYITENNLCFEEFLALYGKTIRGVNYVNEYVVREK